MPEISHILLYRLETQIAALDYDVYNDIVYGLFWFLDDKEYTCPYYTGQTADPRYGIERITGYDLTLTYQKPNTPFTQDEINHILQDVGMMANSNWWEIPKWDTPPAE